MKSTIKWLIASFVGASIYLCSCSKDNDITTTNNRSIKGSGNIVSKNITVENFSEIELKSYGNIKIYKGDQLTVSVSDYENLVDYHNIKVASGRLIITTEPDNVSFSNSKATFIITTNGSLNGIHLNGAGNIEIMSEFSNLQQLSITGSGNITACADLVTDKLNISIKGAGDINAKGSTTDLTANIFGTGNVYLRNMLAQNATCTIAGTGQIVVHAVANLNAAIRGIGNIEYYGSPKLQSSISGIGQIKRASDN